MRTFPLRELLAHALLLPAVAFAQAAEDDFGPTPSVAAVGNGSLVAGVSAEGTLTTLRWPGADGPEHVDFETADATEPRLGAGEDEGVFAGLDLELDDGTTVRTWMGDAEWDRRLQWTDDGALLIKAQRADLGVVFEESLVVPAGADALHRRVLVRLEEGSTVVSARYLLFSNLAPSTSTRSNSAGSLPTGTDDDAHDFAAAWMPAEGVLLHFAPATPDFALLESVAAAEDWADDGAPALAALADGPLAGGTWLALASEAAPERVAVGYRTTDCAGLLVTDPAPSAWVDEDSGNAFAACQADALLGWPLTFEESSATFETVLAAADGRSAATAAAAAALADGFDAALANAPAFEGDAGAHEAFARSVRRVRAAYRSVGGRPASLAEQPPRDRDAPGESFVVDALDLLDGDRDAVAEHLAWLRDRQEAASIDEPTAGELGLLPGAWAGGYRADGRPWTDGDDNLSLKALALVSWTAVAHARTGSDAAARDAIGGHWPMVRGAARLMAACLAPGYPGWDPPGTTLLDQWLPLQSASPDADARLSAMEAGDWDALTPCGWTDDALETALLLRIGLTAAADAADAACFTSDETAFWRARADELGAWALASRWDGSAWDGDAAWAGWPVVLGTADAYAPFVSDADDPVAGAAFRAAQASLRAASDALGTAQTTLAGTDPVEGVGLHVLRAAGTAALLGEALPELDAAVATLVALSGDGASLGDALRPVDTDGDGVSDALVPADGTPHLPAMARVLLADLAAADPDGLAALSRELTPVCLDGEDPDLAEQPAACAGCNGNVAGSAATPLLGLLLLAAARRRR